MSTTTVVQSAISTTNVVLRRAWRLAVAFACGALVASATSAHAASAGSERFAIIVGSNAGDRDEPRLSYAEHDAQRLAEVLTRIGGVAPENLVLLLAPDADGVQRALNSLASRVQPGSGEGGPVLFIYYSGHADAQSLHLRGTHLGFGDLKRAVRRIPAEVSVFIVDACRSGGLVRMKGAAPTEQFDIKLQDDLKSEGLAILTSSSASEDSQESERLGGGVFTHQLITGLLGAADSSRDQRVTLTEAYRYAYTQTLAATSVTDFVQHPTFAFELKGERELVITRTEGSAGFGRLHLAAPGHYLVFERYGARELAAELDAAADTEILLPPGPYLIRRRETAVVYEREIRLASNDRATVAAADLEQIPYRHAVRKGYGQVQRSAYSLGADLEVLGPVVPLAGPIGTIAVAAQLDLKDLALRARVRFGHGFTTSGGANMSELLVGGDLGIYKLFDLGPHGFGFGVRLGADWIQQSFDSRGDAPTRNQLAARGGPFLRAEFALAPTVALTLDGGVDVYLIDAIQDDGKSALDARVVPVGTIGFGIMLP